MTAPVVPFTVEVPTATTPALTELQTAMRTQIKPLADAVQRRHVKPLAKMAERIRGLQIRRRAERVGLVLATWARHHADTIPAHLEQLLTLLEAHLAGTAAGGTDLPQAETSPTSMVRALTCAPSAPPALAA